jgi:hypothetical protein
MSLSFLVSLLSVGLPSLVPFSILFLAQILLETQKRKRERARDRDSEKQSEKGNG